MREPRHFHNTSPTSRAWHGNASGGSRSKIGSVSSFSSGLPVRRFILSDVPSWQEADHFICTPTCLQVPTGDLGGEESNATHRPTASIAGIKPQCALSTLCASAQRMTGEHYTIPFIYQLPPNLDQTLQRFLEDTMVARVSLRLPHAARWLLHRERRQP